MVSPLGTGGRCSSCFNGTAALPLRIPRLPEHHLRGVHLRRDLDASMATAEPGKARVIPTGQGCHLQAAGL